MKTFTTVVALALSAQLASAAFPYVFLFASVTTPADGRVVQCGADTRYRMGAYVKSFKSICITPDLAMLLLTRHSSCRTRCKLLRRVGQLRRRGSRHGRMPQ